MLEWTAIGITLLIGLIGALAWGKISKIITVIKLIANALEDKVITKDELQAILDALK